VLRALPRSSLPGLKLSPKAITALDELRSLLVLLRSAARHCGMKDVLAVLFRHTDFFRLLGGVTGKGVLPLLSACCSLGERVVGLLTLGTGAAKRWQLSTAA
jgi:hypothetical protein